MRTFSRSVVLFLVLVSAVALAEKTYTISGDDITETEVTEGGADAKYAKLQNLKAYHASLVARQQAELDAVNADIQAMLDAGYTP